MLFSKEEKKLTSEYLENGYCIKKINNLEILEIIIDIFVKLSEETTGIKCETNKIHYLNNIHKFIDILASHVM